MKGAIQSEAFGRAALRSERYRIIGVIVVVLSLMVPPLSRGLFHPLREDLRRLTVFLGFWICCAGYESVMLLVATRAQRANRPVRPWVWILNTVIECSLPTVALIGLSVDKGYLGPYRALVSGQVLVYTLFIILSTLRLSPSLSILSGVVSAAGYVLVYLLTLQVAPNNPARQLMPPETFVFFPVVLLSAGLIAAAVAGQIRRHVVAALAEAETRRKLDRVEHDLSTARSIQIGLLPRRPPSVAGYDIAGFSQPADQTGGDYYDWFKLSDGRVIFTVADASGHGIGPALLVTACRAYFRALASHNDPLERITAQVDALLSADITDGRFITAVIALLEPRENRLSLYSAGQAPQFLYVAAEDRVSAMDADQPPLGTGFGDDGARARVIPLAPGDALVLVTDGFFECRNSSGEMLGTSRLAEAIQRCRALSATDLISQLHQDVLGFSRGVAQGDDLTAVVIKRDTG